MTFHHLVHTGQHVINVAVRKTRINSDPKDVVHDEVGIRKITDNSIFTIGIGWLARQIASRQQSGRNLLRFQDRHHVAASEGSFRPYCKRKSKPTGLRSWRCFREDKEFFEIVKPLAQLLVVSPTA